MPTSSIFTNIIVTDQKKVEKFINALEASSHDPAWKPAEDVKPLKDEEEIRKLMGKRERMQKQFDKMRRIKQTTK